MTERLTVSLFLILSGFSFCGKAQQDSVSKTIKYYRLPFIVEGEDTIPVVNLPMVDIVDIHNPEYLKNLQEYFIVLETESC